MVPPFAPSEYADMEGGSERYCFNLSKRLIERSHQVGIYTSQYPRQTPVYEMREGIPILRFRCWKYLMQVNPLSFFWRVVQRNLEQWDLVHVHSYIFFFANQVAMLRQMQKFPYILHLHGGLGYIPPSLLGSKASAMKIFYDHTFGPATMRRADRVIACCDRDRCDAISNFNVEPERIFTIPNSVDSQAFTPAKPSNPINITYIGRLTELKGSHQLPTIIKEIYSRHKNIKFTLVGGGTLESSLRQSLKNYPVTFRGVVPNSEIPEILSRSGVLILPSFLEGFPLVILEAHASSVPVVCYDVGGCNEAVRSGETGEIVPKGDLKSFIDALSWLIDNDKERICMGKMARINVLKQYDWPVAVNRIEKLYKSVL